MINSANNKIIKDPSVRIAKRPEMLGKNTVIFYAIAIFAAILAGGIFVLIMGVNPFAFYAKVVSGCFKSKMAFSALIRIVMPLLITSLGVAVAFRMKFWNIGAEGQFIMGAIFASYIALYWGDKLPHWLVIVLMFVAGAIGGGLLGLIPAFFKCKFGTNETLLTLMFNYVALYTIQLLRDGIWRDPAAGGFPKIASFPKNAWLNMVFGIDITWIVCIVLVILLYIYFKYTKFGYEVSVIGDSISTARYAGMSVTKIIMRTMFISAAICGIAGMLQASGDATSHTLTMGIASGVGFTAIIVAWLAKLNPFGIMFVSIMFGILEKGCSVAKSSFDLSPSVAQILQGIILFVIIGLEFFIRYKVIINRRSK